MNSKNHTKIKSTINTTTEWKIYPNLFYYKSDLTKFSQTILT